MFGIGGTELVIILIFAFLVFGPDKLPQIAQTVGHAIAKFNEIRNDVSKNVDMKDFFDPNSDQPFKNPVEAAKKVKKKATDGVAELKGDVTEIAEETHVSVAAKIQEYDKLKNSSAKDKKKDNTDEENHIDKASISETNNNCDNKKEEA